MHIKGAIYFIKKSNFVYLTFLWYMRDFIIIMKISAHNPFFKKI